MKEGECVCIRVCRGEGGGGVCAVSIDLFFFFFFLNSLKSYISSTDLIFSIIL